MNNSIITISVHIFVKFVFYQEKVARVKVLIVSWHDLLRRYCRWDLTVSSVDL